MRLGWNHRLLMILKIPTANEHEWTRIEFALNDPRIGAVPAGTPEDSDSPGRDDGR
jgi:hypothetical protein